MNSDIAIIGIAGRFPGVSNLQEFLENLRGGHSALKEVSLKRKCNTTIDLQGDYVPFNYIDDIDNFDHKFFNISLDEAEKMDPRQRMLLEESYHALESSGYPISHFWNSNTAVFVADTELDYYRHAQQFSPVLLTGNLNAATAGRIARYFKLRGAALMVDTACSSSLVALHLACKELRMRDADLSLVATASLSLFPAITNPEVNLGISSPDGRTCSFSSDASGSGAGEAITCVLLKRMEDARNDNDFIYAVIKGSAVNQDAHLSGSLTAPSSTAQKEVIQKAWENAGIDPRTISYVECHGSATRLGDPIEIEGLSKAFQPFTSEKQFCAVSSVKSNIGHTGSSAGLAGLTKVVLSLQYRELFPNVHFSSPNPFIDFKNSPVVVNDQLKKWEPRSGHSLRAGLSSFGLSGTNCHVVLEEAPSASEHAAVPGGPFVFTISGKSKEALDNNCRALAEFIQQQHVRDAYAVSYTLARGRDHYAYRMAYVESDVAALAKSLLRPTADHAYVKKEFQRLVFLFDQDFTVDKQSIIRYSDVSPVFSAQFKRCMVYVSPEQCTDRFYQFAFQYAMYHVLFQAGIQGADLVGVGTGKIVTQVLTEELSLEEGIAKTLAPEEETIDDLLSRLDRFILNEIREPTIFVNIGMDSAITKALISLKEKKRYAQVQVVSILQVNDKTLPEMLKVLYLHGFPIHWEEVFAAKPARIPLPGYQFDAVRCWLKPALIPGEDVQKQVSRPVRANEEKPQVEKTRSSAQNFPAEWTPVERSVAAVWVDVLKLEEIALDDDFFKLGGQSLYAIQMMNRIQKDFGIEIGFKNTFQWSTVHQLARQIEQLVAHKNGIQFHEIQPVPQQAYYDVSRNQARLWFLDQFDEEKFNYILSFFKIVEGKLRKDYFEMALEAMIRRHESLRTVFITVDGEPKQKILSYEELGFKLEYTDLRERAQDKDEYVKKIVDQEHLLPIDLENGPLVRAKLLRLEDEKYIYILSIHHIICDGWSIDIMEREVQAFYSSFSRKQKDPFPPLNLHYKDYSAWSNKMLTPEKLNFHKAYWMEHLKGPLPESEFPLDYPRAAHKTWHGRNRMYILDAAQSKQVIALAHGYKASFFMVIFAAVKALYYRYTLQSDVIIGTTVSSRNNLNLEDQIGFYTSTVPIRSVFDPECSFEDLLKMVIDNLLASFDHQWYPFDQLVKDLRIKRKKNRYPLFNILVALRNTDSLIDEGPADLDQDHITVHPYKEVEFPISKYDLTLRVAKESGDRISFYVEHNTQLYKDSTISQLSDRLMRLLSEVVANPAIKIKDIPLTDTALETLVPQAAADQLFSNQF